MDNCPATPNAGQEDGNENAVGDACDCSSEADTDGDGVPNGCDACPGVADPGQADSDRDGRGDACDSCRFPDDGSDSDGDAVLDPCDSCADVPNLSQSNADDDVAHVDSADRLGDACDNSSQREPCRRTGGSAHRQAALAGAGGIEPPVS